MTDWRKIERALMDWFVFDGFDVFESRGDWFASMDAGPDINLTALARHLANELAPLP